VPKVGTSLQHKTKSSIHRIPEGVDSALARGKPPGLPREVHGVSGNGLSHPQGRRIASWKSADGVASRRGQGDPVNVRQPLGLTTAEGLNGARPNGLGK
jgi:hypothetical protein